MKRIYYANSFFITGDLTAAAVLEYASALAQRETSDTVHIPVLADDGSVGIADLLVGPASQLMTVTDADHHVEIDDLDVVADLERKVAGLLRPEGRPLPESELIEAPGSDLDDIDEIAGGIPRD